MEVDNSSESFPHPSLNEDAMLPDTHESSEHFDLDDIDFIRELCNAIRSSVEEDAKTVRRANRPYPKHRPY